MYLQQETGEVWTRKPPGKRVTREEVKYEKRPPRTVIKAITKHVIDDEQLKLF